MPYPIIIRPMRPPDLPFITKSWLGIAHDQYKWLRTDGCPKCNGPIPFAPKIDEELREAGMRKRIDRLLSRASTLIATAKKENRTMCGFIVGMPRERVLHMIYVAVNYRTRKADQPWHVGQQLMEAMFKGWPERGVFYTQHSGSMSKLAQRWNATYNPFLVE